MSNEKVEFYREKLDELYAIIQRLRPSSSVEDFNELASRFTADCTVNLRSMNIHHEPSISPREVADDMEEIVGKYFIEKREVMQFSLAQDGHTVFCETKLRLNVMGDIVDPYFETQVVTFDDAGLVKVLKTYCCWSPILRRVQQKTGEGPYAPGEPETWFAAQAKQTAARRIGISKQEDNNESRGESKGCVRGTCCS